MSRTGLAVVVSLRIVTAVLADFRSFDTLGETTVIFTAGIGIMMLLRQRRRRGSTGSGEVKSS